MFRTNSLNNMIAEPILVSRGQIDAQRWDNHIDHSRQGVIYVLSWYLDTVCEQWEALVWPSAADFTIVMPLPVRSKFGRRVLYQPLFCQYLGIFSKDELTAEQCKTFLKALKARFSYISNYAFNPENFAVISQLLLKSFEWGVLKTHWLHLDQSHTELQGGYSKDRRANLNRARRRAWEITASDDFDPLIKLFEENHAQQIGKIKPGTYLALRKLGEMCINSAHGRLLYARMGTCIHAGILLTHYRGRTIYLFNAADKEGRNGNARAVMLYDYFRGNAGTEMVFDFESPTKESIVDYYAGFGAVAMPFYSMKRNALPFPFRQMQKLRKWLLIRTS